MYRILLVDDEILVRDAIKENIDWKVQSTVNWSEIVKTAKRQLEFVKRTSGGYCTDGYIDAIYGWNGTEQFFA